MKRILVIADDLSGAAEIAGICWRNGMIARVVRGVEQTEAQATIVDTDTRLKSVGEATELIGAIDLGGCDFIYKKIDSVLRGPVVAEAEAMLRASGRHRAALLLPQNPSRGRVIRWGRYLIDGVPLHETTFARDPDRPAKTCDVKKMLGVRCIEPGEAIPDGVSAACAETLEQVRTWAQAITPDVLPVGGADFFSALLGPGTRPLTGEWKRGAAMFVCGTASMNRAFVIEEARRRQIHVIGLSAPLPRGDCVLVIDRDGEPRELEKRLAGRAAEILLRERYANVFVEGGATASALCRAMGWEELTPVQELAPGVVRMRVGESWPDVTIKPGSYPWPAEVWRHVAQGGIAAF